MTATEVKWGNSHSARRVRAAGVLALCFGVSFCFAQSDLAPLIPPGVPVVAGMQRIAHEDSRDTLWLATKNNMDDLNRLVAITDNDPDRRIERVIVADWASNTDNLGNHLLLAKGQFHLANVTYAAGAGATTFNYEGVPVVSIVVESGARVTTRWLAVPREDMAVFGMPAAVELALDRYRRGVVADPQILQRVKNGHDRDASWSSVLLDSRRLQSRVKLGTVDDDTASCLGRIRELDLGIQLGHKVKIHVEERAAAGATQRASLGCLSAALFGERTPEMRIAFEGHAQPHLLVALSRGEYDRWLDSFRNSKLNRTLEAMIAVPVDGRGD